tara:strand:- start:2264 stop:2701 length:438 start_codon:yes stop_codon:yes gene_type:complete
MSGCVEKSQNREYRLVQSGHGFNLEIVEKITIYVYSHKFLGELNIEGLEILEKNNHLSREGPPLFSGIPPKNCVCPQLFSDTVDETQEEVYTFKFKYNDHDWLLPSRTKDEFSKELEQLKKDNELKNMEIDKFIFICSKEDFQYL